MFQGFNRVFSCGFNGGINTEDNADNDSCDKGYQYYLKANKWSKRSNDRYQEGENIAQDEAKNAA